MELGKCHTEMGSVYELEANNLPQLDITADFALGACRVILFWVSKFVTVMAWSCTSARY